MTIVNTKKIRWYVLNVGLYFIMFWFLLKCGEAYRIATLGSGLGGYVRCLRSAISSLIPAFNSFDIAFGLFTSALLSSIIQLISRTLAKKRRSIIVTNAWITGMALLIFTFSVIGASAISDYIDNRETPKVSTSSSSVTTSTQSTGASDYILPESSTRALTDNDLAGLTKYELRFARNEIYARHGRQFRDQTLQKYFDNKTWYVNIKKLPLGTEPTLTSLESSNVELILAYEVK